MHALRARPGFDMELIEIDGTIVSLQDELSGGYSITRIGSNFGVAYNPAAEGIGLPYNRRYHGNTFYGTFLVVGLAGADIADLIKDPQTRELVMG